jgi:hypothetical protein
MTGVYILHYSVFHLLTALIPIARWEPINADCPDVYRLGLISMLALSNSLVKKVITI